MRKEIEFKNARAKFRAAFNDLKLKTENSRPLSTVGPPGAKPPKNNKLLDATKN